MKIYTQDEALSASLEYFGGDSLAANVFIKKYALRNEKDELLEKSPTDMHWRLANEFARIESKKFKEPLTAQQIFDLFDKFKYLCPQGSPMFGIGNDFQTVSLSNCFSAGTMVTTEEGPKPIESISLNEKVLTASGEFHLVKQIHVSPPGNRKMFKIKCCRTAAFDVTENHEFQSISKEQLTWGQVLPSWNTIAYLREGDYILIPHRKDIHTTQEIDISEVIPEKYNLTERNYKKEITEDTVRLTTWWKYGKKNRICEKAHQPIQRFWKINEDFAYFLGLWYGDGCVFSQTKTAGIRNRLSKSNKHKNQIRGITFTFGAHEHKLIKFVETYGTKLFGIAADSNNNSKIDGSYQIVFHSTLIGQVFEKLFGRRCDGKALNSTIFKWPKNIFIMLLQGLADSDGSVTKDGDLRVTLKNIPLIRQFYDLARSHGICLGITQGSCYGRLDFPKNGEFVTNSSKTYLDDRVQNSRTRKSAPNSILRLGDRILVRIESKTNISPPNLVYNLGVAKEHSYVVEGLVCHNCFTLCPPADSYAGILKTDEEIVQLSKRRAGTGLDISNLRPEGTETKNAAKSSTGIIPFMERFSNSIREVGQSGRRGACLITCSVHHPQVLDFIKVKQDKTKVTGANISVRLTDEFMQAASEDKEYEQRWPVDSTNPKIKKMVKAKEVWNEIVKGAHSYAEPGIIFWDTVIKNTPSDCYEDYKTVGMNPCGELILEKNGSCRLLLTNVYSYVRNPFTKEAWFDYELFKQHARIAQRLMDDLVDLELEKIKKIIAKIEFDPEDDFTKQRELQLWKKVHAMCENGRRTGTGVTGVGDAIAAKLLPYDSHEALQFVSKLYKTLKLECYRSSVEMAKELGAFKGYDAEKEKKCPFIQRIKEDDPELYKDMVKYGRRNVGLLTTSPAGTVSLLTQTSSGIEPVFKLSYVRRRKVVDGEKYTFIDQSGDKWEEFEVLHPKAKIWMEVTGNKELKKSPWHNSCAEDINWENRVKLQSAIQLQLCHSISSTVNLPENVAVEEVAKIYETAWKSGCKGITVYRKNCRTGVLVDKKAVSSDDIPCTKAPKRLQDLPCDIYHIKAKGKEFVVLVGIYKNKPYEVFAGENGKMDRSIKHGIIRKQTRGHYSLIHEDKILIDNVTEYCGEDEEAITRLLSIGLRHGSSLEFILHQLEKVKGDFMSFARSMARALKHYVKDGTKISGDNCPECGAELVRQDGCPKCTNCGYAACS